MRRFGGISFWVLVSSFVITEIVQAVGADLRVCPKIAGEHTGSPLQAYRRRYLRVNQVELPVSNFGEMGYQAHNSWPKGLSENYIYDLGIWIGTKKGEMPYVSVGYDFWGARYDMCPGPPEHVKDYQTQGADAHPEDSLYFSTEAESEEEWRNITGNPGIISHEDIWCEYNDLWEDRHAWEPGTGPLGLHIKQTVFGWNTPIYENMVFVQYEIKNVGNEKLDDLYVGFGCDMDVGNEAGAAANDLVGCDISRSFGWTYQTIPEGDWVSPPPYYVGVRFFEGPRADDTVFVAIHPDSVGYPNRHGDTVLPCSTLVLTSYNKCTINYDANTEIRRWQMLAGYDIETGLYNPWRLEDDVPADKRMVLGCGPFDLDTGEVDTFLVSFMFSNGNTGGFNYLISEADAAYLAYKYGWVIASPPPIPNLTAIPGDRKVSLIWDNSAEYARDRYKDVMMELEDTVYKEYDFEGYQLFKSATGRADDWQSLGQWDIKNDIVLLPGDIWYCGDQDTGSASGEESENKGLVYSYIDTNVYNGITYYYAVTSYDFNTRGYSANESDIWVALETGKKEVICQPRAEPNNYIPPDVDSLILINGEANTVDFTASIMGEFGVTGHQYEIHWDRIKADTVDTMPIYAYNVLDKTIGEFIFPKYFELSHIVDTTSVLQKRDSTISSERIDSTADSMLVRRTIVWDTIFADTTWLWVSEEVIRPFDALLLQGTVNVPIKGREYLASRKLIDTLIIKPDAWNNWRDTTRVINELDSITVIKDTTQEYFELPDTILIENDIGPHVYDGKLQARDFYSSGKWGNPCAYHGGVNIEIRWEDYNGSPDSLTMYVVDMSTGVEIPYDSAFGDNWCFTYFGKPASPHLTGDQSTAYRIQFYISGVMFRFNGGVAFTWDKKPDAGDIWKVYSSTPSIPPSKGNVFGFGTQKFQYSETFNMDLIKVVPNPYLVRALWDRSKDMRKIEFTHLPSECTIRIYTLDGVLIKTLQHTSKENPVIGGAKEWNLLTENEHHIASGIYIYHVSTPQGQSKIGKFAVIVGK